MKNNIFILIALVLTNAFSNVAAQGIQPYQHHTTEVKFASYPQELKPIVQMAMRIPEVRQLLAKVQQNGPVKVEICRDRHDGFEGYWDGKSRCIVLDGTMQHNPGKMISTLIFELHNADTNHLFVRLNEQAISGQIDKETFVRETERIEHQNVLRCSKLVNTGIHRGIIPKDARMPAIRDFNKHYQVQQLTGHSQFLSYCFDEYSPHATVTYQGTIPNFHRMRPHEKDHLLNRLVNENVEFPQ